MSGQIPEDPDPGNAESGIGYMPGPVGGYGDPYRPKAPRKPAATQRGKTKHEPPKPGTGQAGSGTGTSPDPSSEHTGGGAAPTSPPKSPQAVIRVERQPPIPKKPDQFPWHALRYPPVFRFFLRRADGTISLLENVIGSTWDDHDAILTGNIQIQEPKVRTSHRYARVAQGDQVACQVDVHDGQGFKQIWSMRTKSAALAYADGTRTFDLANDLSLLQQSEGVFHYTGTAGKLTAASHPAKKGGWYGRDIILSICDDFKVPVGAIYDAYPDQKFGNFFKFGPMSPLEAIKHVLTAEWNRFKRRLTARWIDGALYITPLRRSPHLRALGPTLIDAAFKSELRPEFASAIRLNGIPALLPGWANASPGGKGSGGIIVGKGAAVVPGGTVNGKHQQTYVDRQSDESVRQFGWVRKIFYSPDARSVDDLNREADDYLAAIAKPKKTLQLTLPGIPYIYRGDAITLGLGDSTLRNQIVWVTAVTSTLTPQQYLQTITVVFDDPFVTHDNLMKIWLLKKTLGDAVGNRDQKPTWPGPPPNNKGDKNAGKTGTFIIGKGPTSEHTGGG